MKKAVAKKSSVDVENLVFGKVPPQAVEIEKAVLGAILIDKNAFYVVSEFLKPECFYSDAYQRIFAACLSLFRKSISIDLLTVIEELKVRGDLDVVGGMLNVSKLTNNIVSSSHIEAHARIVLNKYIIREMIKAGAEIVNDGFEDDAAVEDMIERANSKFYNISVGMFHKDFVDIDTNLMNAMQEIDKKMSREKGKMIGVPSGFKDIDYITGGFQNTDLIILAARPSIGKTALALNIARNAAKATKSPVGFFSLEMSAGQLTQRLLSSESEIDLTKIRDGELEPDEYNKIYKDAANNLHQVPIFIDDTAALSIFEFKAKARRLVSKHKARLIIIDYLQLMSGEKKGFSMNKNDEISLISRELKVIAKELQIPIIALSQLSRGVDDRENKEPKLSDLRDSGAIEQDADLVLMLYMYDEKPIVKIAKHRNGSLKKIKLKSNLRVQKFTDFDAMPFTPKAKDKIAYKNLAVDEDENKFNFDN